MPIDHNIVNQLQPFKAPDVLGSLDSIMRLRRLQDISANEQAEMALKQREAQENEQFKQVLVETGGDPEKAIPRLMQINPKRAMEFQKLAVETQGATTRQQSEAQKFADAEKARKEDEAFQAVMTETQGDIGLAMPRLMAINPKRALEYQKLARDASSKFQTASGVVGEQEVPLAFDPSTGRYFHGDQDVTTTVTKPTKAAAGSLEAQMIATMEKELGRPLTAQELEAAHGRWGKADDRPINVHTGGSEPLVAIVGPDGKPVLVTRGEARGKTPASTRDSGGGRGVTSGDANRLADFDTSLDDVKVLRQTISGIKATGTKAAAGAALWNPITELTGWGVEAKQKQAVIDRVKQVIGKALEGGVLRKEDEYKYTKILPTISDTPEVAKAKLDGLEKALIQRKATLIDSLDDAGYNTDSYKQRVAGTGGGGEVERWERGPDGKPRKVKP